MNFFSLVPLWFAIHLIWPTGLQQSGHPSSLWAALLPSWLDHTNTSELLLVPFHLVALCYGYGMEILEWVQPHPWKVIQQFICYRFIFPFGHKKNPSTIHKALHYKLGISFSELHFKISFMLQIPSSATTILMVHVGPWPADTAN